MAWGDVDDDMVYIYGHRNAETMRRVGVRGCGVDSRTRGVDLSTRACGVDSHEHMAWGVDDDMIQTGAEMRSTPSCAE
eukprot:5967827-Pyramimonas_sp.AAC.1